MKRIALLTILVVLIAGVASAHVQFRAAGNMLSPLNRLPESSSELEQALALNDNTLTGWHWEVLFDRIGLGMHYAWAFYEAPSSYSEPWLVDWKGDFFFSYHFLGAGSLLDPFVEYGWGNAGTAVVRSDRYSEYPDWENEVADGDAVALTLYSYVAAGLAVDLQGLYLGARLAYMPRELYRPVPVSSVGPYDLRPIELGLFAGIALGGRDRY
jgi:hypothetical protein